MPHDVEDGGENAQLSREVESIADEVNREVDRRRSEEAAMCSHFILKLVTPGE